MGGDLLYDIYTKWLDEETKKKTRRKWLSNESYIGEKEQGRNIHLRDKSWTTSTTAQLLFDGFVPFAEERGRRKKGGGNVLILMKGRAPKWKKEWFRRGGDRLKAAAGTVLGPVSDFMDEVPTFRFISFFPGLFVQTYIDDLDLS